MVEIQFIKPCPPYNAGEAAGFGEARARQLVSAGVAVFRREPEEPPQAPAPKVVSIEKPPQTTMVKRPRKKK